MRLIRPILFCAAVTLAAGLSAQQPLDAKVQRQYESLLRQHYSRDLNEVFAAMERSAKVQDDSPADVRFMHAFRLGDWMVVRSELAKLPADLSRGIYDKMLSDLAERPKSGVRLEDVFALSDAVAGELTDIEIRKLGQMLGQIVPPSESFWVAERLKRGTEHFGGKDPARRLAAGRLLLAGGFKELAREYLPDEANLEKIADEGLRAEVAAFLATEQVTELAQRDQVQRIWDDNLSILKAGRGNDYAKSKAATALVQVLTQVPSTALSATFDDLIKNQPDVALRIIAGLEQRLQTDSGKQPGARMDNLRAQTVLAGLIADHANLATGNWKQVLGLMAESWMTEAETVFSQRGGNRPRGRSSSADVDPEEFLSLAPEGKWLAVLSGNQRDRFDASLSRAIIASANFEKAADRIVDIARRHPEAGLALAEDFLQAWGQAHNPQLPEDLRKRYGLAEDARIPITPVMMERNIESLALMMNVFRKAGVAPRDQSKVVTAFDLAYSNAEAYRDTHIEKVFGPTAKMDEQVFFLLAQKMHANLFDRWRRVDLQRSSLTRRNEAQTYAMVEAGYTSVLKMIDQWSAGREQAYKALTLGGVVLNDWADFESFQELNATDPSKRIVAAKERMLQSQDYFQRAADAYGKAVTRLKPSEYTIEGYLSWFNAVVGIGSNGQVNLSKPMNRAALTHLREAVLKLPGKTAGFHMGQLAKTLNGRLTDTNNPLHEDIKYRYLASALVVTKNDPFTLGLKKRSDYLDELLSEIQVKTTVDGPNTVGVNQEFGIVISVVHTEAMGRVARFGQYLSNDTGAVVANTKRRGVQVRKTADTKGPRDEFEQTLNDTLSPFFTIRSITFALPDVKPRSTNRPGWEETPLAYVLVRAKDASVDKIPPVQMELRFIDLSGPVTIPATSSETLLKVATTSVLPRPAEKIEVIQTLDTRQFAINGSLTLDVSASATGLVPDLEDLLDLSPMTNIVKVRQITPIDPLMVKELNTWADNVAPRSERRWQVTLDGDPIRAADKATDLPFPTVKAAKTTTTWRTYQDMDPIALTKSSVMLDRVKVSAGAGLQAVLKSAENPWNLVVAVGLGAALLAWLAVAFFKKPKGPRPLRARDIYKLPEALHGFSVVALLRRILSSDMVNLSSAQRIDIKQDIAKIEHACFNGVDSMSETELKSLAMKWVGILR